MDDGLHDDGAMERDGIFANPLADITRHEGHYSFHVRAQYGAEYTAVREATWSVFVATGIDPENTEVVTRPEGNLPDGRQRLRVTITPKDRYGNRLGPGRLDSFEVYPQPGSEPLGPVGDAGNGSYGLGLAWDQASQTPPGLVVTQPGRPPVALCNIGGAAKPCRLPCWAKVSLALLVLLVILLLILLVMRT